MAEAVGLLELVRTGRGPSKGSKPAKSSSLLGFLVSHCSWKDGQLTA